MTGCFNNFRSILGGGLNRKKQLLLISCFRPFGVDFKVCLHCGIEIIYFTSQSVGQSVYTHFYVAWKKYTVLIYAVQ